MVHLFRYVCDFRCGGEGTKNIEQSSKFLGLCLRGDSVCSADGQILRINDRNMDDLERISGAVLDRKAISHKLPANKPIKKIRS